MENIKKIMKNRPAFHVDKYLKEAAKAAAKAFEQEERDAKKEEYAKF